MCHCQNCWFDEQSKRINQIRFKWNALKSSWQIAQSNDVYTVKNGGIVQFSTCSIYFFLLFLCFYIRKPQLLKQQKQDTFVIWLCRYRSDFSKRKTALEFRVVKWACDSCVFIVIAHAKKKSCRLQSEKYFYIHMKTHISSTKHYNATKIEWKSLSIWLKYCRFFFFF